MEIRELTYLAAAVRIIVAFLLGGILGMERGLKQRPAGLRTYMLVSVGACIIMMTNQYIHQVFGTGDPVRMGAQVVSGIGFLGAGTIIVTKHSQIKGLTTAAGLWAAAGVGLATGIGFYEGAVLGAVMIFLIMTVLSYPDNRLHKKTRYFDVYIELDRTVTLGTVLEALKAQKVAVDDVHPEADRGMEDGRKCYMMALVTQKRMIPADFETQLQEAIPGSIVDVF